MSALTLLIIRHAEKLGEAWPGPGLTDAGVSDDKSLVIRGWQRAGAWAALFGAGLGGANYPKPARIYAATPGQDDKDNKGASKRPFETICALAPRLGITADTSFGLGDEAALMAKVLGQSGVVLIAWEHKAIAGLIVPKIPVASGTPPDKWPGDRFDVVLRFDRAAGATKFAYRQLFPCLLSGDSETPF
ncbi:MAG: histidine phosphatase family protein [Rhizomicrobium sp.]|jgi:hypothetical protein